MAARHRSRGGWAFRALAAGAALVTMTALTGCGGSGGSTTGGSNDAPGADVLSNIKSPVQVEFWHSMKGANVVALNKIVDAFNDLHKGKIVIKPVFQGDYDQTIAKYKASVQQKHTPPLVQVYDIGSRFMLDSKQTVPMYKFIDKDKWDASQLEPNIANYYTFNGKQYSMPFNSSVPLLYLNVDLFRKAGLDPTKPPKNLDELTEAAKKLTVKDAATGRVTQYGFNAAIYGWFLEQWLATAGDQYCDNSNGRKGLANKVLYDSTDGVKAAQWWTNMVKDGYASNTGRKTDDAQNAFKSGTVGMTLESTGELRDFINGAKGRFTVAAAPFPKLAPESSGGTIIGGASLWINGVGHTDAEKRASWEFVKFAASPEEQAVWHTGTGYFPVNKNALGQPADRQWINQYPQFTVAVDQLHSTKPTVASAGCALGVMPQARQSAEEGLEKSITGADPLRSAQDMKEAADSMKKPIQDYNRAVKSNK